MSLSGALSSAISALKAQSTAIAVVSDNIANSGTYGYKTTSSLFESLVTGSSSSSYSSGGVTVYAQSNITEQGLLTSTSTATNVAIDGNGFFVVSGGADESSRYYSRNGAFELDSDGYLVCNGYYLQGWRTDADGNVTVSEDASSLESINTNIVSSTAEASTETAFDLNLPSDAATGDTFTTTMQVYDSLGASQSITVSWEKTGTNAWSASFSSATSSTDSATTTGTVTVPGTTTNTVTLSFNDDGSLASTSPSPATIGVAWTTGAADSTITLDLGTAGGTDGLTQYSSGLDTPAISLDSVESDGLAYGTLSSIAVGDNGMVEATYSNGKTMAIYKIAVATFTNADGLSASSDGIYAETADSGSATLHESGEGAAGTIYGSELEGSTTDTSTEFSNMIQAQQAYSAAAQVVSTVSDMYDTLMSAMR
jgi:flagellar hook protein FlgE